MLPGIEGFKILQEIRKQKIESKVIMLTAKSMLEDKLTGFDAGNLRLNIKTTTLLCKTTNESIEVVCKEFMLFEYFIKNENRVIPKEQLYEKICGLDSEAESNNSET